MKKTMKRSVSMLLAVVMMITAFTAVPASAFAATYTMTLEKTAYVYDGSVKKPKVTVKKNGKALAAKKYKVKYQKGRKAVGTYKVRAYIGKKTLTKTFTIKPQGTEITNVTPANGKLTVKWKKQTTQTTGYQLQYSLKPDCSGAKTITLGKDVAKRKISGLKKGKKYYLRIRTYKTVSGKKICSKWQKFGGVKAEEKEYYEEEVLYEKVGFCRYRSSPNGSWSYTFNDKRWQGITPQSISLVNRDDYNDYLKRLYEVFCTLNLNDNMTDLEKYLIIERWIGENVKYDKSLKRKTAYTAFRYGETVCGGYASLLYDLCFFAEVPCELVDIPNRNHVVNAVKIGGYWYGADITNGLLLDTISNESEVFKDYRPLGTFEMLNFDETYKKVRETHKFKDGYTPRYPS